MTRNQLPPQIKKIEVLDRKTGKKVVRYRLVVDTGVDRITGQRSRFRRRFKTEREAREELGKLTDQVSTDSFVPGKTEIPRLRGDAERLNMMPGHPSRRSLVIIAVIIFFIIFFFALGLYAAIAGRLTNQSIPKHPDRLGLLGPHLCLVVTESHRPPPLLFRTHESAQDYGRIAAAGRVGSCCTPGLGQPGANNPPQYKRETYAA
jgi:hypothetical protein